LGEPALNFCQLLEATVCFALRFVLRDAYNLHHAPAESEQPKSQLTDKKQYKAQK